MSKQKLQDAADLRVAWERAPAKSLKIASYFDVYTTLFASYRNTDCTFIETGVLGGGSLLMWRDWLGPRARVIGVDLNPQAKKWEARGFEVFIGDQGDPSFWESTLAQIGRFDVLLDDGGHQSFQQIVTLNSAIRHARNECLVVIEDVHTSFMSDFADHDKWSFMNYAKACSEFLTARSVSMFPNRMLPVTNSESARFLSSVRFIQFFDSIVAFSINPNASDKVNVITSNKEGATPSDFRYRGLKPAEVLWPDPYKTERVTIRGR